jgi:XTP/dITP diphosphohydrolase
VDALGGAPGVYSARYAGEDGNDAKNNVKLLAVLSDVPMEQRTAKFVSVITMVYPDGTKLVARGEVRGHIMFEEKGDNGFGYDPLFVPEGFRKTFAELTSEEKNHISHRANALRELERLLQERNAVEAAE